LGRKEGQARRQLDRLSTSATFVLGAFLLGATALVAYDDPYYSVVALGVLTYAALGLGLTIVMGYAGLLDMGYAAFFAIGAYTSAICQMHFGLNFFLTVLIAIAITGCAGVVIGYPTLRMRPDYLAIVTIGFGEIIRTAANNWDYVGASRGLYPLPVPSSFGFEFLTLQSQLYLAAAGVALAATMCARLGRSPIGLAWRAIRDDDFVTESLGLPTLRLKMGAYIAGGVVGALAGAIFAARSVAIDPTNFTLELSVQIVMMVVIGGLGSIRGVLLASLIFVALPELLRSVQDYRLIMFALAVIIIVRVRPQGLFAEQLPDPPVGSLTAEVVPLPTRASIGPREPVLTVKGVSQNFAGIRALDDVTFDAFAGCILGVIGPNGAGKTTLVNAVTGIRGGTAGSVHVAGRDVTRAPAHVVAAQGVARTFQTARLVDSITVLDNVMVAEFSRSRPTLLATLFRPRRVRKHHAAAARRALESLETLGIAHLAASRPPDLSYADRRRVEIARALTLMPRLMILDEPAAGMNPTEKSELAKLLRKIADSGVAVILIEHDMPLVSSVADELLVLDRGRVLARGDVHDVLSRPDVIDAYLGKTAERVGQGGVQ
jgi:branched-chain amino acid transport system permease protein